jgi:N-acetyltransferase
LGGVVRCRLRSGNLEGASPFRSLHRTGIQGIFRRRSRLRDGICFRRPADRPTSRLIGSSRYYGYDAGRSEIEIGWTFIARSHWGGTTNREVKRLMLDHAFTFVDTVIFWVGEQNWRSQGAMTKIGGVKRSGLFTREATGAMPHFIFEIGKSQYQQGGRALVA